MKKKVTKPTPDEATLKKYKAAEEKSKKYLKELEDNSKKASSDIIQFCKAIDKKFSGFSTYVKCWEFLAEHFDLYGSVETTDCKKSHETTFKLEDAAGKVLKRFSFDNWEAYVNGDWDWTLIYKEVLAYIIKKHKVKTKKKRTIINS